MISTQIFRLICLGLERERVGYLNPRNYQVSSCVQTKLNAFAGIKYGWCSEVADAPRSLVITISADTFEG